MKNKTFIFIPSLTVGTLMAISSSSWFMAWIGLEINLMSVLPIIINKLNFLTIEASIKYFLVQAISSLILIFASLLHYELQTWNLLLELDNIYFFALSLKAGVAPLHFWFPQVMMCSDWTTCMILLTWQKIAPFILMSYLSTYLIKMFIISSALIGVLGGINHTNVKMILIYSSIANSAWMLSLSSNNELLWWMYFLSYTLITLSASYIFIKLNLKKITSLYKMNLPLIPKIMFMINFLSLAGLPPFLGFFIKILTINSLMESNMSPMIITSLTISTVISFYFYMRTNYVSLFINENCMALKIMNEKMTHLKSVSLISMTSTMGILITPFLVLLT